MRRKWRFRSAEQSKQERTENQEKKRLERRNETTIEIHTQSSTFEGACYESIALDLGNGSISERESNKRIESWETKPKWRNNEGNRNRSKSSSERPSLSESCCDPQPRDVDNANRVWDQGASAGEMMNLRIGELDLWKRDEWEIKKWRRRKGGKRARNSYKSSAKWRDCC